MKKILLILLIISGLFASCKTVGTVQGRKYVDVLKEWKPQDITVYVCNADLLRYYIDISDITPTRIGLGDIDRALLIESLKKAIKWAKIAKKKKVPSFTKKLYNNAFYDKDPYSGAITNYLYIEFFAANHGLQNDIILNGVDFNNQFEKNTVYLSVEKVPLLIKLLQKAKKTYKEVKKADQIAKEFK